jgi:F-type H+-transporting ATPase subunit gamma
MAKGRELKGRIRSVENTRKITHTLEMVATSKIKRAQDRVVAARPYASSLTEIISNLYTPDLAERFPLLRQPTETKRVAVLLLTSHRGLAGAFNGNLIKEARSLLAKLDKQGAEVELHVMGKKGIGYFRYIGRAVAKSRADMPDRPTIADAGELIDDLIRRFADREIDAVHIVYAAYKSALSTPPTTQTVLPVAPPEQKGARPDYILLPSADAILTELLPSYVRNSVYKALVETTAGYYSAQRNAMKSATDNAGEMINVLRRTFNRARQAQITQEIAEIVGGAAAQE